MCDIQPSDVVAVWGAGRVGQFAMDSARVLGAATQVGEWTMIAFRALPGQREEERVLLL
jgi:hypothetical protein